MGIHDDDEWEFNSSSHIARVRSFVWPLVNVADNALSRGEKEKGLQYAKEQ